MQRIICLLVVLTTPLLLAADAGDGVHKELKALQGKWKTVAMEVAGKSSPRDQIPAFTVVIAADGKSTGQTPEEEFRFTITVNPNTNPKTIENLHESGEQKGKRQYGIYKLEGDKFTVCMTPPGSAGDDRPKDFTTKDTTNVVFVFERVKEDNKDDTIDGAWLPSSAELAGRKFPDDVRKTMKLVVKDDKYTVTVGTKVDQGTVELDRSAKPKALDITGTDGPNKGRKIPAIYERKGDTLRICYDLSGKSRPTEFKTETGTQLFLVTYKREKR